MYSTNQQGQYGPYSSYGSYGWAAAAQSGFFVLTGWPDRAPVFLYGAYNDFISPWYLIVTLIAALDYRRRSGKGLYLDQSQIEAGINFLGPAALDYTVNGRVAERAGNRDPYLAPHGAYPCRGRDRWCTIAVRSDGDWQALCRAMGNPEWTQSPQFATLLGRKENEEELTRLIGEWTKDYTAEQIMAILQAAGVPSGVVETCEDLFNDPQLKHRQHYRLLRHKVIGPHYYHAPAYKLSKAPVHIWKAGPALGEDNEYVYKKILGLSDDEVADLLVEGVITTETDRPAGF
jgi:benzylsuccinate CoA-transferase BbsF subunit